MALCTQLAAAWTAHVVWAQSQTPRESLTRLLVTSQRGGDLPDHPDPSRPIQTRRWQAMQPHKGHAAALLFLCAPEMKAEPRHAAHSCSRSWMQHCTASGTSVCIGTTYGTLTFAYSDTYRNIWGPNQSRINMFHHLKSNRPDSCLHNLCGNNKPPKHEKPAGPCPELEAAKAQFALRLLQIARYEHARCLQAVAGSSPLALLEPDIPDVQKRDWLRVVFWSWDGWNAGRKPRSGQFCDMLYSKRSEKRSETDCFQKAPMPTRPRMLSSCSCYWQCAELGPSRHWTPSCCEIALLFIPNTQTTKQQFGVPWYACGQKIPAPEPVETDCTWLAFQRFRHA